MMLHRVADMAKVADPLAEVDVPLPGVQDQEILIRVSACGVCHTELDEIEGRLPARMPLIPGHQVVGRVVETGSGSRRFVPGDRVGVAWIYRSCGQCRYCRSGRENLCDRFEATGCDAPGGYAQYMTVQEGFAYPIPPALTDIQAAPLLCAGAIGHRSLRLTGIADGGKLGLTGFGASAHLVLKLARHTLPATSIYVFARNPKDRAFARQLGACWAGATEEPPPEKLDAIIDTTPAWTPVLAALGHLAPGGRLVINAIRKEAGDTDALMGLDYARHLWQEKEIKSVANVTRQDVADFLEAAARYAIYPQVRTYPLAAANQALADLKQGRGEGAKVLQVEGHDGP